MDYSLASSSTQLEIQAQQAYESFMTPSKRALSDSEQALLNQATSFSIPFEGTNLNAFSWGEAGSTVLLVHGWSGCGLQLGSFVEPLLDAGHQVLAFDAPAHGSTTGVQTSGLEIAQAIAAVVEHQAPVDKVIAHSLGATSTTLALSKGMVLHKAVYIGALCWLSRAATTFAKLNRLSPEVDQAMRQLFDANFGGPDIDIWQKFSTERNARKLSLPLLLFHDHRDREVFIDHSEAIAQAWSGARLIKTAGLGHQRILRNEAVIRQTVDFLSQA